MNTSTLHLLISVTVPLLVVSALAVGVFFMTSQPLRREERARFVLELIESALEQGQPVEHYIVSLAHTRDPSLSSNFHLLAAHLEQGTSLAGALEKVPGLGPPQMAAMLEVGESLGNYALVLPACRELLHDGLSESRALINYQAGFAFFVNPIIAVGLFLVSTKVAPVFSDIRSTLGLHSGDQSLWLPHLLPWLALLQALAALALFLFARLFLGGPRFSSWLESTIVPTLDWMWLRIPWRHKRLQCDFSAMLALLLDAQVPEERAVKLAALSTSNEAFISLGRDASAQLQAGAGLPEALRCMDDTGEFQWRVKNAGHSGGGFFQALKGWHEWLHARAFQQEQTAAQVISTGLLLINALSVGLAAALVLRNIAQITAWVIK